MRYAEHPSPLSSNSVGKEVTLKASGLRSVEKRRNHLATQHRQVLIDTLKKKKLQDKNFAMINIASSSLTRYPPLLV